MARIGRLGQEGIAAHDRSTGRRSVMDWHLLNRSALALSYLRNFPFPRTNCCQLPRNESSASGTSSNTESHRDLWNWVTRIGQAWIFNSCIQSSAKIVSQERY
jgi:hypothetical protein